MEKTREPELKFSPLTEGLGFHPFSDGLPYAPVTRARDAQMPREPATLDLSSGTGAVAAGRPRFATTLPPLEPRPAMPRPPTPASAPAAARVSVPVAPALRPQPLAAHAGVAPEAMRPLDEQQQFGAAYVLKRVFAYLLDSALNLSFCVAGLSVVLVRYDVAPELLASPGVIMLTAFFLAFFNWAMIAAQEVAFGSTVGKRVFGLQLRGSASAAFLRAFFFLPSLGFLGLGVLWALLDRRRRCWHDLVVDLQPLEIARID